jgi:hypothetical protein
MEVPPARPGKGTILFRVHALELFPANSLVGSKDTNFISSQNKAMAFGERAYRYHPPTGVASGLFDWRPMHSMHTPEEVRAMLGELRPIGPAIETTTDEQTARDYDSLISVLEKLDKQRRMLFVQVETCAAESERPRRQAPRTEIAAALLTPFTPDPFSANTAQKDF